MKVCIGTNIKQGPWGGGNLFAINLSNEMKSMGYSVVFNLDEDDIDIILITEPRKTSESSALTNLDVKKYINFINPNTIVVHRINECDERKQTNYVNKFMIYANKVADATVFVSSWLKDLYLDQNIKSSNINVIMAGADSKIFNSNNLNIWDKKTKLKIVTHHWGANWNKGFDTYKRLDDLLEIPDYKNKYEFTYIGNLPKNFNFRNSKVINPLSGEKLAREIKKNHVYITGSLNEPSGNHHIEASQCGLPTLYIDSGGIPEYCNKFGIRFDDNTFVSALNEMYAEYSTFQKIMKTYPYNSKIMSQEYIELFKKLLKNRDNIIQDRSLNDLKLNNISKFMFLSKRYLNKRVKN
jgi:hypothetical protein